MHSVTWLLATTNAGKIREMKRIMEPYPIEVKGLKEMGIEVESPETGHTFLDNAFQKAEFYFNLVKSPVFADDSGLEVDALDGAPGIHSARFGGFETHAEKCAYLLDLLKDTGENQRTARFRCAAVFFDGEQRISASGALEGAIARAPAGYGGFGYDPIFCPTPGTRSLAEYEMAEKNKISHRGLAFSKLMEKLREKGYLP